MRLLIAVLRPEKLPDVKEALFNEDVKMMTVFDVKGCGQQSGYMEEYRGVVEEVSLHRKVMLMIAVNKSFVDKTIKAIIRGGRTNKIGDGKIFVLPLEDCIRLRTGESGPNAIGGSSKEAKSAKQKVIEI